MNLNLQYMLYIKRNDEKTVNIIAQACLSKTQKIAATAVAFFLGVNNKEEEEEDEEVNIIFFIYKLFIYIYINH